MTVDKTRTDEDGVAGSLVELGMMWARFGLTAGSGALVTSARSLEKTASALKVLSSHLEQPSSKVETSVETSAIEAE